MKYFYILRDKLHAAKKQSTPLPLWGGGRGLGSFVKKEFLHIFRDRRTMLMLLVMPVALILLFGYAVTNETKNSRVAFVAETQNGDVRRLRERIDASAYFSVVADLLTSAEAEAWFAQGRIDAAAVVSKGNGIQILVDGSEPNQASVRSGYLQQIILKTMSEIGAQGNPLNQESYKSINVETRLLYNPQARSEFNFVPGVIGLILMVICAMMTSISIVREKELGTLEVLFVSPLHPLVILVAKLIPYFVVSSVNVATTLLLSKFVIGVPVAGNIIVFSGITLLYIIVALSLGMLISTAVSTQLAAMLLSLLLIVPSVYLSGLVFPIESMPVPITVVSKIVPTTWYIDAARKLMIQGVAARFVVKDTLVLALQAVLLLGISLKLFKTRLE